MHSSGHELPVLAIRARTSEERSAQFIHEALEELHTYIYQHDLRPPGPPLAIVNDTPEPGTVDVEAAWPINRPARGAGRIHGAALPTALVHHRARWTSEDL
jgi:hypothetical protein